VKARRHRERGGANMFRKVSPVIASGRENAYGRPSKGDRMQDFDQGSWNRGTPNTLCLEPGSVNDGSMRNDEYALPNTSSFLRRIQSQKKRGERLAGKSPNFSKGGEITPRRKNTTFPWTSFYSKKAGVGVCQYDSRPKGIHQSDRRPGRGGTPLGGVATI